MPIYFLFALATVPVHQSLLEGTEVVRVDASGSITPVRMTLSSDKFTVTIAQEQSKSFFRKSNSGEELDVGEMARIQRGQSTQQFEKARSNRKPNMISRTTSTATLALDPERSFSIIFRGAHTVDLMANSLKARNDICDSLDRILVAFGRVKIRVAHDIQLLRYVWRQYSKTITVKQIYQILQEINYDIKQREVNAVYEKFGKVIGLDRTQRKSGLTFEQMVTFLHKLKRDSWVIKPVTAIWNDLFGEVMNNGKQRLTVSDKSFLEGFLHSKQDQPATLIDVGIIFRRLHDMEIAHTASGPTDLNRIGKDQFEAYLLAVDNAAMDPNKEAFCLNDMNRPLSEYWINSSHNTYLIGDQYTSHSRVEMYSKALYRGSRCLELDIWDGGKSAEGTPVPVVWHGHTMTSKIRFVDIINGKIQFCFT
jgi:phosphatidylinositol phospholipase C delta